MKFNTNPDEHFCFSGLLRPWLLSYCLFVYAGIIFYCKCCQCIRWSCRRCGLLLTRAVLRRAFRSIRIGNFLA